MKINIDYISPKYYSRKNIKQWFWYFKRYIFIKGFIIRILGLYINVRENNAAEKIAARSRERIIQKNKDKSNKI